MNGLVSRPSGGVEPETERNKYGNKETRCNLNKSRKVQAQGWGSSGGLERQGWAGLHSRAWEKHRPTHEPWFPGYT